MSAVERSVLQMLMIPNIRDVAMEHMFDWMFSTEVCAAVFKALHHASYQNRIPDPKELVLRLHSDFGVSELDCEVGYQIAQDAADTDEYDLEQCIHHITEFARERFMDRGVSMLASADSGAARNQGRAMLQDGLNLIISSDNFYDFSADGSIDTARDLDLPTGGKIIRSHFNLINESSLYGGFKYGDLVMVSAAPGVGKSTAMVCDSACAITQGFRSCHIFLGDMSEYDAFIKYLSYWTGVSTNDIIRYGHGDLYTAEIREMFGRLRVKVLPAVRYDVIQVLARANQIRRQFEFDMLVIDYDANVRLSGGSLYDDVGNMYANLKSYGQGKCVVEVGSQTKPAFWGNEIVPLEAPNDSSKKQMHIDFMIGIGRNPRCPEIGTVNIPKMRRGVSNVQRRLHMDYAHTRENEISQSQYDALYAEHASKATGVESGSVPEAAAT